MPTRIAEAPDRPYLVDFSKSLQALFHEYGYAINDDLVMKNDFVQTVTADYLMKTSDHYILVNNPVTVVGITLPYAAQAEPHPYVVKKIAGGGFQILIGSQFGDTLETGFPIQLVLQYEIAMVISDRAYNWWALHIGAP
jgi:hypothetical protein